MRLSPAHEGDWWRIAEIVQRVARYAKDLPCFRRGEESGGDNAGMRFKHLDRPFVLISFLLAGGPYVGFAILAATNDVPGIITECGVDLTA